MRQHQTSLVVETNGKGLYDFSARLHAIVADSGMRTGLCTIYITHTSASLLIQENADVEVQRDLERFFARLVPEGDPLFRHVEEGPDDMPAHVRAALTQTSVNVPIRDGKAALGTWQGMFLYEHRNKPYSRTVIVHIIGD